LGVFLSKYFFVCSVLIEHDRDRVWDEIGLNGAD
jgi:hypothetical protein